MVNLGNVFYPQLFEYSLYIIKERVARVEQLAGKNNLVKHIPDLIILNSEVTGKLDQFNKVSEEEFLLAGSQLNDYKNRCKNLISDATELSDELSGDFLISQVANVNSSSQNLLDHINKNTDQNKKSFKLMNEIEVLLNSVSEHITGFKKIIKTLKMLGISTLIESARLGDGASGFTALAEDVEALADNIEDQSQKIDKETKELIKLIAETIGDNIALGEKQKNKIIEIITELNSGLGVLESKHNLRLETVNNILIDSNNINTDISQVVTSIQFHDITRQQIEHVVNSLSNVNDELSEINEIDNFDTQGVKIGLCRDIAKLENAQLENSKNIFCEAVGNIKDSLEDVQNNIGNIAQNIIDFIQDEDNQNDSFLEEISGGLQNVNIVLSESSEINSELQSSLVKVGETVKNLSQFLKMIEEIGQEVELLPINASIKAAHTGNEGAGLGVIADTIQKLSSEAMAQTIAVSEPLKKITEDAQLLVSDEAQATETRAIEAEITELMAEMNKTLQTIQNINSDSSQGINKLNQNVISLQQDIKQLNARLNIDAKMSETIIDCRENLSKIVNDCFSLIGDDYQEANKEKLEKIAERYTMLSEREIHSSVHGSEIEDNSETTEIYETAEAGSEFGENIELF